MMTKARGILMGRFGWRLGLVSCGALAASAIAATTYGPWGTPVSAEVGSSPELNTVYNDGCPILSPDGLDLYMASNRPGGLGGQDIWVAHRATTRQGWGAPVNAGAPVNSAVDDYCPTPVPGGRLYFVSRRDEPNGDIYLTQRLDKGGWAVPKHLGPEINSADQEWSPSLYTDSAGREFLYFSSTRPGGPGGQDIYYSMNYGPAQLAPGAINTVYDDARPNVSHTGKEIVFDSTRPGGLGASDVWTANRAAASDAWPAATNVSTVNSAAGESRASLSWDGSYLLFGTARAGVEGPNDIFVAKRERTGETGAD